MLFVAIFLFYIVCLFFVWKTLYTYTFMLKSLLRAVSHLSFQCRRFSENTVAQMWYFVKCIYFGLSAYQIRCGYPTRVLGNFLTKSYNYVNLFLFQGWVTLGEDHFFQLGKRVQGPHHVRVSTSYCWKRQRATPVVICFKNVYTTYLFKGKSNH